MDIYITNKATGERLRLPLLPDKVAEAGSANEVSHSPITIGEASFPRGQKVKTYSWEGTLPGVALKSASWVSDWQEPEQIVAKLRQFMNTDAILQLMVTGTSINNDVYLQQFSPSWSGGGGHVTYSISFKEYKRIVVRTVSEAGLLPSGTGQSYRTVTYYKVKITTKSAGGYARIYVEPSTSSKILAYHRNGDEVEYLTDVTGKTWARVIDNKGIKGYMSTKNITYSRREQVPI